MLQVKIIRAAFREIQKLPLPHLESVYKILRRLSQQDERDTKSLKGYDNLLRTRLGDLRVIWQRESSGDIVVIKAGLRGDVYDDAFDERDRDLPITVTELINPQGIELAEHPAYHWNHEQDDHWYKFVYGTYRYSPILTPYQRGVLEELRSTLSNRFNPDRAWIVQSSPGTGKTVCATLFACEIHRQYEFNTMLIVPEALRGDIAEYSDVKQALQQENFWLVTFREWLSRINPEFQNCLASPDEELYALREATRRTHRPNRPHPDEITSKDVLLYQSFVLDKANINQTKNAIFQVNIKRIQRLNHIDINRWLNALSGRKCRVNAADELKQNPPHPPLNNGCTLIIVDEAQDFMLCEMQALIAVCQAWRKQQHPTYLLLLGDLNQRIQPTDFDWGQLHLKQPIRLGRNYRNSRHILEFANQFWNLAQNISKNVGGKHLPPPASEEDAFEVGESVRLLECASNHDALKFLQQLAQEYEREEDRRYLLHHLANAVKVVSPKLDTSYNNLVILNAEQAKGREFEACVAFRLFDGTGEPSLEESFQWYTLLTRARSRLLVVVTKEELNRLNGHNYFKKCDRIDKHTAISWITELASDVELNQMTGDVQQRLLQRCETGYLYWDTYLALELAGVEQDLWEQEAIAHLSKHSQQHLNDELKNTQSISLRCLLLRAMQHSWQAVAEASKLQNSNFKEYERLLNSIARDLEAKGFPYEAARVKTQLRQDNANQNLPFWSEVSHPSNQSKPLVTLLCQAFTDRLANLI
ncbi:DEAD/DEAH box helicase family protein [Iningainema tapete]|uniref:DEAD/DEAH box helicase family protein n=1 Tax=Iningainema tapete BLCC-T55 TaxID=2748662 RepID=A0A8J6XIT3_9CYAN|nr:DEAD/DEAH box helicase family protein [Iningainema tapete]MBD2771022.1 DEAD/DEAH box helicase family protein [Iningainema tapete BLCC-T55]